MPRNQLNPKIMLKKIYLFIAVALLSTAFLHAQVTTSSITGVVKDPKNEVLVGATVVLTHEPTNTVYTTTTRKGGVFDIQNINPGGPYKLEVTNVGFETYVKTEINIPLGDTYNATVEMTNTSQVLTEVVVNAAAARNQRTGAATNVSRTQVLNFPNISRSLMNVSRLTPQSNNTSSGTSFMGMSPRLNSITIDGSLFNNNFGLGSNALPGGASQPISIDAIDQVQINVAPYDVRQAGFTGAGLNAVTRRGTNNLYVTAYDFYKNQSFNGKKVDGSTIPSIQKSSSNLVGASVGGPIIKNKLFFFGNFEYEKRTNPGQLGVAYTDAEKNNPNVVKSVSAAQMDSVRNYLMSKYQYDPGVYQGYNFNTTNTKFLVRLDWNINDKNRFSIRYNQSQTKDDQLTNTNSGPSPRINNGRIGAGSNGSGASINGLNFSNSNYVQNNNVYSVVGELNSKLSASSTNQLLVSYTKIHDFRSTPGKQFPFVDIMRDANNVLMSFGSEIYSYNNDLKNTTWNVADNFSYTVGRHNLLAGASFDYLTFENSFSNFGGQSYYRFNSLNDFLKDSSPTVFALTYSNTDRNGITPAAAKFGQLGFYLQDIFTVNPRFRLTYGLRFDLPFYPGERIKNDSLYAVLLKDPNGNDFRADVSTWPKQRILVSPRVGFTYNLSQDNSWVLRGGSGIFTGRIPFIWLVNQSSDNNVLNTMITKSGVDAKDRKFDPDRTKYVPDPLPTKRDIVSGAYYSVTAPDFKMPQTWRNNLAIDKSFARDFVATLEAIYSKTINGVYHWNANLGPSRDSTRGDQPWKYYKRYLTTVKGLTDVLVMDNTSKGYSLALTAQIQKRFSHNWQGSIAYTYNIAKDVSPNNGDRSQSSWTQNNIILNPNDPELSYSAYSVPHRVTAYFSYRLEYANKAMATTFGLFYSGSSQGRYHYKYSGDVNGDGTGNDLLYVPTSRDGLEQQFTTLTTRNPDGSVKGTYTPVQQADAFWTFVQNDKFLNDHKGKFVDRYSNLLPWTNQLNLRILQDFSVRAGGHRHTLQASVDVENFLNLLNNSWGNVYALNYGSFAEQSILGVSSGKFTFDPTGEPKIYKRNVGFGSTWGMQVGIRYIF